MGNIKEKQQAQIDFESWPLDRLSDYIVETYHRKAEEQIRIILPYLDKLAKVQGSDHPELFKIKDIFKKVAGEIAVHQKKEELMLFPFIKKMARVKEENTEFNPPRTAADPVNMLTEEHDAQGEAFKKIAELSNHYTTSSDNQDTYNETLGLLKSFENELLTHIHLENNILFPQALKLEKELREKQKKTEI